MHSFLRIVLLGVFTAVGVGLAVSLAITSTPATPVSSNSSTADDPTPVQASARAVRDGSPPRPEAVEQQVAAQVPPPAVLRETPGLAKVVPQPVPLRHLPVAELAGSDHEIVNDTTDTRDRLQPVIAGIHPELADHVDRLENAIQQVEQFTRQGRDVFRNAFSPQQIPPSLATMPQPVAPHASAQTAQLGAAQLPGPSGAAASPDRTRGRAEVLKDEGDDQLSINIQEADVRKVLDLLSQHGGMNILASKNVMGTVTASLTNVDIHTALDAILRSTGYIARRDGDFIFVGTPEDLKVMDQRLDKIGTRIYRPNYVPAAEIQSLITPMLSPEFGTISVSSPAEVGIAANANDAGGDGYSGSEVLLVRDYEAVLVQIDQIVEEVDQPPLQVAIEAMILSVSLDDSNEFGVSFELLRNKDNLRIISGNPLDDLAKINVNDGGLKIGFLDGTTSVFVKALETVGDTSVVATPRLLCLNKQRAEILIGEQLGYVSTTVTENAATQAVEFLEVGTQLRLRPFISRDGMIRMEVHPELSTGNVRIEGGFTLPDKEVTQVTTNIMCRDGSTVVIGGLIREDLARNSTQIPLLGSLPIVGPAFRQKTEDTNRNEIIVLITPHIVFDPEMAQQGSQHVWEFNERRKAYLDNMSPLAMRELGRRHFELAQDAWENGNFRGARKHINLAIHFDPLNQDAVNFRNEKIPCWSGYAQPINEWSSNWPYPHHDHLAPWMLEEFIQPHAQHPVIESHTQPPSTGQPVLEQLQNP